MILVDANLLLHAWDSESPHHEPSRNWLESALSFGRAVRFALITLLAFVRIASDHRIEDGAVEEAASRAVRMRHDRAYSGSVKAAWIPACAGMTSLPQRRPCRLIFRQCFA